MIDESFLIPFQVSALPAVQGPWLVFAPHADDEAFGMGGTLALAAAAGLAVHLAVVTDGALGGKRDNLVSIRQHEARQAAAILGISSVHFLDEPDRGLQVTDKVLAKFLAVMDALQPQAVFFPGLLEPHPDHRACALVAWQAMQRYANADVVAVSYEISVQSPVNCLVDITSVLEKKQQAMAVYLSQLAETNYEEIVLAMNRLRTFSLPATVRSAEGFYCYSAEELGGTAASWIQNRLQKILAV